MFLFTSRICSKLNLIKEVPNFEEETFATDIDAFDHESFAQTLFKIINDNHPPLTIGLFGSGLPGHTSHAGHARHLATAALGLAEIEARSFRAHGHQPVLDAERDHPDV